MNEGIEVKVGGKTYVITRTANNGFIVNGGGDDCFCYEKHEGVINWFKGVLLPIPNKTRGVD